MTLPPRKPPASRLRVSDKVQQTFEYACLMRDFDVADRLLEVLEHMATRTMRRFGEDRRRSQIDLSGARETLRLAKQAAVAKQFGH